VLKLGVGVLRKGEMLKELVRSSKPELCGGETEKSKARLEVSEERWAGDQRRGAGRYIGAEKRRQ